MGTSGIYSGPKGNNPLLPEWYIEENKEDNEKKVMDGSWQAAKTQMSKYVNGTSNSMGSVFRSYMKAVGGSRGAVKSAISGKNNAVALGKVVQSISVNGFRETLMTYKIAFTSKSLDEVLSELASIVASDGATKEEAIARKAILDSFEYFYERVEEENIDAESLSHVDESLLNDIMERYFCSYILEKILCELESRIEVYSDNSRDALRIEDEIRDYIEGTVKNELDNIKLLEKDYNSEESISFVNKIFESCYRVLEESI